LYSSLFFSFASDLPSADHKQSRSEALASVSSTALLLSPDDPSPHSSTPSTPRSHDDEAVTAPPPSGPADSAADTQPSAAVLVGTESIELGTFAAGDVKDAVGGSADGERGGVAAEGAEESQGSKGDPLDTSLSALSFRQQLRTPEFLLLILFLSVLLLQLNFYMGSVGDQMLVLAGNLDTGMRPVFHCSLLLFFPLTRVALVSRSQLNRTLARLESFCRWVGSSARR
jgi:hypothetical protein